MAKSDLNTLTVDLGTLQLKSSPAENRFEVIYVVPISQGGKGEPWRGDPVHLAMPSPHLLIAPQ